MKFDIGQLCNGCGKCCEKYPELSATEEDYQRWLVEAPKIAKYADRAFEGVIDLWFNPRTREACDECPWMEKHSGMIRCKIYSQRPEPCRNYPVNVEQMERDECEILKHPAWPLIRDLVKPD